MVSESFNFSNGKILVVGDVMLDEYWVGETNRISPEAPVPIVLIEHTNYRAGGAANVALNAAAFGCKVDLLGIVGDDISAKTLNSIINQIPNCSSNNLILTIDQPTINKLRIISNNQQLFRLDKEGYFSQKNFENLTIKFQQLIANNKYDLIVLSDYAKGTLQDPQIFINTANQYNIPIIIDPKNQNCSVYKNATLLTPNFKEFQQMVNTSWQITNFNVNEQQILEKGHNLINELNLKALIITRGKDGLSLLTNDYKDQHFTNNCHEVFDVTGAGDTVTASIAACLSCNHSLHTASYIATIAAGIVVSKLGTSTVTINELQQELQRINLNNELNHTLNFGIIEQELLKNIITKRKLLGEIIVLVNGCFDIIHAGHISYLEKAKSFGDRLIVAVNDDLSIKQLKGNSRPINCLKERMQVLAGLKAVDWVVPFSELRPGEIIKYLNPNILVKTKEVFKTIEDIPENEGAQHILNNGGKVYLLDRPLIPDQTGSSTKIIEAIKSTFTTTTDKELKELYDF